jgi:hypothetical protein
MTDLIDRDVKLPVPCLQCGYEIQESIRNLESNPQLTCPSCNSSIEINADDLKAKLTDSEKLIDDIRKRWS